MASSSKDKQKDGASEVAEKILSGLPDGVTPQQLLANTESAKALLSERLAAHINASILPTENYPPEVKRRIKALKRLQLQTQELEAQFYLEVQQLEAKYQKLYQPLYDHRHDIIMGSHEPTDEEAHWSEEDDEDESDAKDKKGGETDEAGKSSAESKPAVGVNQFWLITLKNCEIFADVIKEHDEPVLAHLTDIKVVYADDKGLDFRLEFCFSDNEWFSNKVLVKSYKVLCEVNKEDPWSFEGASIVGSEGCKIDWKKGKDLTVKTVKKKQKNKGKGGQTRTITKTVPNETFFSMFEKPKADQDEEEVAAILSDDYTRAEFLRDRLVPKAVLFFTGEALEEDDEEFEEDYSSPEDEGDQGEDYDAQNDVNKAKPPECKQQ